MSNLAADKSHGKQQRTHIATLSIAINYDALLAVRCKILGEVHKTAAPQFGSVD